MVAIYVLTVMMDLFLMPRATVCISMCSWNSMMMVTIHVLTVMTGYVSTSGATSVCTVVCSGIGEYDDGNNVCTDCADRI